MVRRAIVIASALVPALGLFAACGDEPAITPVDAAIDDAGPDLSADEPDVDQGPTRAVWANSTDALFRLDPDTRALTKVATFGCAADLVFDIAVDEAERIVAVTSLGLVTVDPKSGACTPIAAGVFPHAIAFLPRGVLDPQREVLVGYNLAQYVRIDDKTGVTTPIGNLNGSGIGPQFVASGDLVVVGTTRIEVTLLGDPDSGDLLATADPKTGRVVKVVKPLGELGMTGLGQWAGTSYAFGQRGDVLSYRDGSVGLVYSEDAAPDARTSFSGAAVTTRAPTQ